MDELIQIFEELSESTEKTNIEVSIAYLRCAALARAIKLKGEGGDERGKSK